MVVNHRLVRLSFSPPLAHPTFPANFFPPFNSIFGTIFEIGDAKYFL